jgi:tetratricopeptide (TPR) repeat protein
MGLSIVIPTRNRNNSLSDCIQALEHNEADIVVVDDASDEPVVLTSTQARIVRHSRRRGRGACINTGLNAARHDAVLIMDDDIYAAPDMVIRLLDEFNARKNPKLCLTARVTWDPDVPLTLTMRWMESVHKFPAPMLVSKSFVLEHGGFDENFTRRLEDTELHLRLKQHGMELCRIEAAVGFQNNMPLVRDLVEREFMEGISAVFLHAKFPEFMPQVDDMEALLKNESQASDASAAVDEIALMEQSEPREIAAGVADLYAHVCRHYFLHGIFETLRDLGAMKPRRNTTSTLVIYREAARLQEIGELDEARRLFRLVLQRQDEQYWDGAEYHLGSIELALDHPEAAHAHFSECLRLNPAHNEARRALYKPAHYREVESNVFEAMAPATTPKVLFILFGDLGHVVNAVPVIMALTQKFASDVAWLTSADYASLARACWPGDVHETKTRGAINWEWIHDQGFTHVFFPEPGANLAEWQESGLHASDFIAKKCGVAIDSRATSIQYRLDAQFEAEEFLRKHNLSKNAYITAWRGDSDVRHWPNSNLTKLAINAKLPVVVFGKKGEAAMPRTIACTDQPLEVIAVLISWSSFYLGPSYGASWLATATGTPLGLFYDPKEPHTRIDIPRSDIQEWTIYTNLSTVLDYLDQVVVPF